MGSDFVAYGPWYAPPGSQLNCKAAYDFIDDALAKHNVAMGEDGEYTGDVEAAMDELGVPCGRQDYSPEAYVEWLRDMIAGFESREHSHWRMVKLYLPTEECWGSFTFGGETEGRNFDTTYRFHDFCVETYVFEKLGWLTAQDLKAAYMEMMKNEQNAN